MFIDTASIKIKAGDGGRGAVNFRQEKYIDRGGPDGGDGGRGGHVIFKAAHDTDTLASFRHQQELKAEDGQAGGKQRKHGKNGEDLLVTVPVGTVVSFEDEILADFTLDGQEIILARGGDGGFGNAHFKSSTRQAPRIAEVGEPGERLMLTLELKLMADVGLVGFPNAGKSTLLSVISSAKPEIADYPFTTLTPNLGVVDVDSHSLLVADIPGLIEGASEGKGLGDEFLRHIERTSVLLHLIDIYEKTPVEAYKTITNELKTHSLALAKRPRIVVLTKIEGLDPKLIDETKKLITAELPKTVKVMAISAASGEGLKELLRTTWKLVEKTRNSLKPAEVLADGIPVIELDQASIEQSWKIKKTGEDFVITGRKIEKFAARTDFNSPHGLARLRDIMKKMGIAYELRRQGVQADSTIYIGRAKRHQIKSQ